MKKPTNRKGEENIQAKVCTYIRLNFPSVHFLCDLAAGLKLSKGLAVKASKMRSADKLPDIYIFASRGGFSGLFIELKIEGGAYRKDGTIRQSEHIQAQNMRHEELRKENYKVCFAEGFYNAIDIIKEYLDAE